MATKKTKVVAKKTATKSTSYNNAWSTLAVARIMVGFVFFWAFLDKTMGLGFATESGKAWLDGVSPTTGFLKFGVNPDSPFADFFAGLAGNVFVDWLFMLGLLGIGLALIFGIGLRIAAVTGSILLVLMWAAEFPLKNNPLLDEHIIYSVMLYVFAFSPRKYSLINQWLENDFVKKNSWLW